jgi:hypothetical protein
MPPHREPPRRGSWHSQPVVWLGIAIFTASLAGCLWLIVVSARYDDARLPTRHQVFGVPTQQRVQLPPP